MSRSRFSRFWRNFERFKGDGVVQVKERQEAGRGQHCV